MWALVSFAFVIHWRGVVGHQGKVPVFKLVPLQPIWWPGWLTPQQHSTAWQESAFYFCRAWGVLIPQSFGRAQCPGWFQKCPCTLWKTWWSCDFKALISLGLPASGSEVHAQPSWTTKPILAVPSSSGWRGEMLGRRSWGQIYGNTPPTPRRHVPVTWWQG